MISKVPSKQEGPIFCSDARFLHVFFCSRQLMQIQKKTEHQSKRLAILVLTVLQKSFLFQCLIRNPTSEYQLPSKHTKSMLPKVETKVHVHTFKKFMSGFSISIRCRSQSSVSLFYVQIPVLTSGALSSGCMEKSHKKSLMIKNSDLIDLRGRVSMREYTKLMQLVYLELLQGCE